MEYKRFENTVFARIDKGEEIVETLKTICEKEDITLAYVNMSLVRRRFRIWI